MPGADLVRRHVLKSLAQYWRDAPFLIESLPVASISIAAVNGPLKLKAVNLPSWASSCGVDGILLVPCEAVPSPMSTCWNEVDWFLASFLILECVHERAWENTNNTIHSYSFRIKDWDKRIWDYAWVNRYALFLRQWAAVENSTDADQLFGSLPKPCITLTHDVDAISKTSPIRIKFFCFKLFNIARYLFRLKPSRAFKEIKKLALYLLSQEDWNILASLAQLEASQGIKAVYHFYADYRPKSVFRWLLDPDNFVRALSNSGIFRILIRCGHHIGLHPSIDSWNNSALIATQRANLSQVVNINIVHCRQHWLRFSWQETWLVQEKAGIAFDSTLMFNDRSGFRNGAAVRWCPWNFSANKSHQLSAIPTVLMDSHLYDYEQLSEAARQNQIIKIIRECKYVHGHAYVLWHPHTLTKDYGWIQGFDQLLAVLKT